MISNSGFDAVDIYHIRDIAIENAKAAIKALVNVHKQPLSTTTQEEVEFARLELKKFINAVDTVIEYRDLMGGGLYQSAHSFLTDS